jgi:hypothetical protein
MRGNCLCGAIEFEIVGEVRRLYQCHCSLCRKQSGSTSNSALLIESENFRWLDRSSPKANDDVPAASIG